MSQLFSPALVGRRESLRQVRELLSSAQQGRGGVLVISGEPGVGKSRLLKASVDAAEELGMQTLQGRTTSVGAPLRSISNAFLTYSRRHPLPDDSRLAGFRRPLSAVLPEWQQPSAMLPDHPLPLVAEGVVRLLRVIAPLGVLLSLDDVHWADPESVQVLDHLADTVADERIAVILTMRSEESVAWDWVASAGSRRTVRTLELERLSDHATTALIRACLGSDPVADPLLEHVREFSDGLPLLVEDLLASLASSGALVHRPSGWELAGPAPVEVPRSFADLVTQRLALLDGGSRRVLDAAAVVGRRFEWRLLPDICGLSGAEVLSSLRSAMAAQLVVPDSVAGPDEFRFRHALTREVVLGALLPPERAALAATAAIEIERTRPGLPGDWLLLTAQLHAQGGCTRRAVELLLEAAGRSLTGGALGSAETALRQARRLVDDQPMANRVDAALTQMLALAGRVEEALAVGAALLARAPESTIAHDIHLCLARATVGAGDLDRAGHHLSLLDDQEQRSPEAHILHAVLSLKRGHVGRAAALAADALNEAESAGHWAAACEALETLGQTARLQHASLGEEYFERAHQVAQQHDLALWRGRALHELGTIDLMESGRRDRLDAARREAEADGDLVTVAHVDLHLGLLLAHLGDAEESRRTLERVARLATRLGLTDLQRVATAQLGYVLALRGDVLSATHCIERVRADPIDDPARIVADGLAEPFCSLLADDRAAAVTALDEAVQTLTDLSWPQWGVRALLRSVDGDDVALDETQQAAGEHGPQRLIAAYLQFARAVSLGRRGDPVGAATSFDEADATLGWQTAHRPFCYRQVGEAALRDGWGDPATWLLTAAEALPAALTFGRACRRLVRDSGAPVRRRGRGDAVVPDSLRRLGVTSREVDVLLLVAQGLGNQQIADRLHLSRRTVESHVAHLLSKTGAADRFELAPHANSVESPTN